MAWYIHVAHFFGGAFAANALPHLIAGVSGKRLPTPFASPPFRGLSPPTVNVAWALVNLAVAYALLVHVGELHIRSLGDVGVAFAGFGVMGLMTARSLAKTGAEGRSS